MPFDLSHVKAFIQTLETDLQLLKDAINELEQSQQQEKKNCNVNAPCTHKPLPSQSYLNALLAFAKNLQNLKRKKERNLKWCALFACVLGQVEFYVEGWLALGVSHTPWHLPSPLFTTLLSHGAAWAAWLV